MPIETPTRPNFKEWLDQEAVRIASDGERKQKIKSWIEVLNALQASVIEWIREVDEKRILSINPTQKGINEEGLGSYEVPALRIKLGDAFVDHVPVGKYVVGTLGKRGLPIEGQVDLKTPGKKFYLFATQDENTGDTNWFLTEDDETYQPLTKETYLSAIQDLLS